jgi:glycosyltransferase
MLISIITASYNASTTVQDTLASVANQRGVEVEHIIQDGGSTDDTIAIVAQYPTVSWQSEPDQGLYDAMNKGIARSNGEIIGLLNADDFYPAPDILAAVAEQFRDPSVMAVYGDLDYVDAQDKDRVVRRWRSGAFRQKAFLYGWMPPHPTFFVRKQVYEQYGAFDLRLRISADYELMLRLLYQHQVKARYLPLILVKMRTGGVSNATWRQRWLANREDRLAWKVNGLKPYFFTRILKPLRKLGQFIG